MTEREPDAKYWIARCADVRGAGHTSLTIPVVHLERLARAAEGEAREAPDFAGAIARFWALWDEATEIGDGKRPPRLGCAEDLIAAEKELRALAHPVRPSEEGREPPASDMDEERRQHPPVLDLMAALKASLAAGRPQDGGTK